MWRFALSICVLLFAPSVLVGQTSGAGAPPFVPGEILVKVKEGTSSARLLEEADQSDSPCFDSFYKHLLGEIEVPLRPPVRHSGGVILVAVDFEALARRIKQRAMEQPEVREVDWLEEQDTPMAPQAPFELSFRLAFDPEDVEEFDPKRAGGSERSSALAKRIVGNLDYQTNVQTDSREELVMVVDPLDLTQQLADRLSGHSDVEFAQPNYVSEPMGTMLP